MERISPLAAYTFGPEPTPEDEALFDRLTTRTLANMQLQRLATPPAIFADQREVLAIHWHTEHVPLSVARTRLQALYPNAEETLVIPTDHNVLHEWDTFAGVEVDCREDRASMKVQLLLHFRADKVREAHTLRTMVEHTARYRILQLEALLATASAPRSEINARHTGHALRASGMPQEMVDYTAALASKLLALLAAKGDACPRDEHMSPLLRDFINGLRPTIGSPLADQLLAYTKGLRDSVKGSFPLSYFHSAHDFIEETRALGGCFIIPHPEQFWPVLMAGYDADGLEVWNPQSRRYTDLLIDAVRRDNAHRADRLPQLVTMGDDTHLGEHVRPATEPHAPMRELGQQPGWTTPATAKLLEAASMSRLRVIREYRDRLLG